MKCRTIFRRTVSVILVLVLFVGLWPEAVVAQTLESLKAQRETVKELSAAPKYLYSLEDSVAQVEYENYLTATTAAPTVQLDFMTQWAQNIAWAKDTPVNTVETAKHYYAYTVIHLTGSAQSVWITVQDETGPLFIVLEDCTITGRIDFAASSPREICIISIGTSNSINGGLDGQRYTPVNIGTSNLYICGDAPLTITGGKGTDATSAGTSGGSGMVAVVANAIVVDSTSDVRLVGGAGGNGAKGADSTVQGAKGSDRKVIGGSVGHGGTGGTGGTGGNGGSGADAVQAAVYSLAGNCWLIGGKGGDGAKGGKGGKGGTGGDNTAWGGSTGNGGQGGTGGKGGDAGIFGANAAVQIEVLGNEAKVFVSNNGCGNSGSGGDGGDGGDPGTANRMCGGGGTTGPTGATGSPGAVPQTYADLAKVTLLTFSKQYDLYTKLKTWENAASAAREKNAWLISVNSEEEQSLIHQMHTLAGSGDIWIGLKRSEEGASSTKEIFRWQDGTAIIRDTASTDSGWHLMDSDGSMGVSTYTNWAAGEPNDAGGVEDYIHLSASAAWNDNSAEKTYGYLTETNYYTVTVEYISEDGILLQTEKHRVVENGAYSVAVQDIYGYYTECASTLTGNVGADNVTLQVLCKEKWNRFTIAYQDIAGNTLAFAYSGRVASQDGQIRIPSPLIGGYQLVNEADSEKCVTWVDQENGYTQTFVVQYCLLAEMPYTICTMLGSEPVADMTVTFNGQTKKTNSEGNATFTYTEQDVADGIDLRITGDGYYCEYSKGVDNYSPSDMGIGYVNLLIDTDTNPNFSVVGEVCYGKSIKEDYAYINVKYNGHIPIVARLNASGSPILKACLVQDQYIYDADGNMVTEVGETGKEVPVKQRVILQTVEAGHENMSADGQCIFSVPASSFFFTPQYDCPVYVYMYVENAAGRPVIQKLNIIVISLFTEISLDGLFEEASLKLDDTGVDFLDGMEFKLETDTDLEIPLDFAMSNNEIYVGLGVDCKGFLEKTTLGNAMIKSCDIADAYLKKCAEEENKGFGDNPHYHADGKVKFESKLCGGFVIEFCEDGVKRVSSRLALEIKVSASFTYDMVVIVIPVTCSVQLTGTGRLEISGLGYDLQNKKVTMPRLEGEVGLSLKVSMGVGCRFASVGGAVQGGIKINLVLYQGVIYEAYVTLSVAGGIYAKLTIGFFTLKAEKMWSAPPKVIYLVQNGEKVEQNETQSQLQYLTTYHDVELYTLGAYRADLDEVYSALDADATVVIDWDVGPMTEIDYAVETAAPTLVEVADGVQLMVYFASDSSRHFYDAKKLVYRVRTDGVWSEEKSVDSDLTADAEFSLCVFDGKAYLAYTNSNSVFDSVDAKTDEITDDTLTLAQRMELVTAAFDVDTQQFGNFNRLTADAYYDSIPLLREVNGVLYLAWRQNRGNDQSVVFGTNTENYLYMSKLTDAADNTWSEPVCLLNRCYPITDMAITGISGQFQLALVVDEDANLYTAQDRNMYFVGEDTGRLFVDRFGMELNGLQTGKLNGNEILVWYNGGQLYYMDSLEAEPQSLLSEGQTVGENYIYANLSEHVSALFWMETGIPNADGTETVSEIYVMYRYDNGLWTQPTCLSYAAHAISDYDVIATNDGKLMYAVVDTYIQAAQAETDATCTYSNLTLISKLCYSTSTFSFEPTGSKTLLVDEEGQKLEVVLRNNTPYRICDFGLKLTTGGNAYYYTSSGELLPGESKTVKLSPADDFGGPDMLTEGQYTLAIESFRYYDLKGQAHSEALVGGLSISNPNQGSGAVSNPIDYALSGQYIIIGDTEYLSLRVENVGTDTADALELCIYQHPLDSEPIYSAQIQALYSGHYKFYLIKLEKEFFAETYQDLVCRLYCYELREWGYPSVVASVQTSATLSVDDRLYTLKETEEIVIQARKPEGQAPTVVDALVEAPILSSYYEVFDLYTQNEVKLSIELNGGDKVLVGALDETPENGEDIVNYHNEGTHIFAEVENGYLNGCAQGLHEIYFLYTTSSGNYLRTTLQVEIVDTTPIQLTGNVTIVDGADGASPVEYAIHGMVLQAMISDINADGIAYQWMIGDRIVSTEPSYYVDNANLGHEIRLVVTGTGVYTGELVSQNVPLRMVNRVLGEPRIETTEDPLCIRVLESFYVGDGTVSYGYATENDPLQVVWSNANELTLPEEGMYYIFSRVTGGTIYADVISAGTEYMAGMLKPVEVVCKGSIYHQVLGQRVTVSNDLACKAGYWDEGTAQYIWIPAVAGADGRYSFVAPDGVQRIVMVVIGDLNADGCLTMEDKVLLDGWLSGGQTLSDIQLFAADVNGNYLVNSADRILLALALMPKSNSLHKPFAWQMGVEASA